MTEQPASPDYDYYEAVTAPLTAAEAAVLRERIADGTAARRTVSRQAVAKLQAAPYDEAADHTHRDTVNAPLRPETITALRDRIATGGLPVLVVERQPAP